MPSSAEKKPIYLSKSIEELNNLIDCSKAKSFNLSCKRLVKSANTLFKAANDSFNEGDEEKSYILFMRFYDVYDALKKSQEYKNNKGHYDSLIGRKNMILALENAETLQKSLKKRYNLKKEEKIHEEIIQKEKEKKEDNLKVPTEEIKCDEFPDDKIDSLKLFDFIVAETSVLILDVRSISDYKVSHINHKMCVNIPPTSLQAGLTAENIVKKLPTETAAKWHCRLEVDYVIIMDWSSSSIESNSPLSYLKDAMCKWDVKKLKHSPLILDGGFDDWILHYPTMTTNPSIKIKKSDSDKFVVPDIVDVEYPDWDSVINHSKPDVIQPKALSQNTTGSSDNSLSNNSLQLNNLKPSYDRSVKPNSRKFEIGSVVDGKISTEVSAKDINIFNNAIVENQNKPKPEIDRGLKPSAEIITNLNNKLSAKDSNIDNDDALMENELLKNYQSMGLDYKKTQEEFLRLKEENKKMVSELEKISKDKETFKNKEFLLNKTLKENEQMKLELECRRVPKSSTSSQEMKLKPDVKVIKNPSKEDNKVKPAIKPEETKTTVKLKKNAETTPRSSGLTRSHSSPNIAKLVAKDLKEPKSIPNIDRASKPMARFPRIQSADAGAVRQRNLMPVYGNQGSGLTGLKNLGNTCFMNSIIQCLANTVHLCFYFISGTFRNHINRQNQRGTRGDLSEEFSVIIRSLWSNQFRSITPKDFKSKAAKYIDVCVGYEQQDSHEFLTMIMEKLHQDVNTATIVGKLKAPNLEGMLQSEATEAFWKHHQLQNQSVISELFEGLMCSTLQCLHCSKKSFSFEEFICLSLPIPSSHNCSLQDCLKAFLKPERMSGEGKWLCPSCKVLREAEKKIDICKLPKILIIHLKRFSYDGMWRRKLQTFVDFPSSNFNLTTFIPGPDSRLQYSLYGLSNHYGTLEGGHYTAFCKNVVRNSWFKFDDNEVSEISPGVVKTSAAYILFYTSLDQELPFLNAFNRS